LPLLMIISLHFDYAITPLSLLPLRHISIDDIADIIIHY
jgi:hypothetical protein